MNAIVILFREKNHTSAQGAATVNGVNANIAPVVRAPVVRSLAWPRKSTRRRLTCIWRINPASGRPEYALRRSFP